MPHGGMGGGMGGGHGWHGGGYHGYGGPGWGYWGGPGWGWGAGTGFLGGVLVGEALSTPYSAVGYSAPQAPAPSTTTTVYVTPPAAALPASESGSAVARMQVRVPPDVAPGERFTFDTAFGRFEATCPQNIDASSRMCIVECPQPKLSVVTGQQTHSAPVSSSAPAPVHVVCVKEHAVDELDASVAAHRVLTMRAFRTA